MSLPALAQACHQPSSGQPHRLHVPDTAPGSVLGCAYGRLHHAFWYWSDAAGGRYLCRCCHAWAVARYVVFAGGVTPRGGVTYDDYGNARAVL